MCKIEEGPISQERVEIPLFDCMRGTSYNLIKGEDG